MKVMLEEESRQKTQKEKENIEINVELEACKRANEKGKRESPTDREREPPKIPSRQVLPSSNHHQELS